MNKKKNKSLNKKQNKNINKKKLAKFQFNLKVL